MSLESQADLIWQYAMRADPIDGDANNASLTIGNSRSGGDTTTDFSDQLGSIQSKFSFHGQTQIPSAWIPQATLLDGPESQKENIHLSVPSGSSHSAVVASGNCKATLSSHVTSHVTGASPRVATPLAGPINVPVTAPSNSVPVMDNQGPIRAFPIKPKAVSFLSPKPARPPPTLPRSNTMPPRLDRYTPRNIDCSSQDSFAGPLPPQDLNTFVRNSRVFNNTYIRVGRDGRPGEVFEHPTHASNTTTSFSEPSPVDEIMSSSQSSQEEDRPSVSQVMRAAFDPRLSSSPIPVPEPVILVRDSQPQRSEDGKRDSENSNCEARHAGKVNDCDALPSRRHSPHLHTPSSSVSYELPQEPVVHATESDSQSTQPNTQPTQTDSQHQLDMSIPPSTSANPDGRSPLPIPSYRQRQVAALHIARLRATEVIPETPASTTGPTVHASTNQSSLGFAQAVDASKVPPSGSADTPDQMGKGRVLEDDNIHTKPSSKGTGKERDPSFYTTPTREARSAADKAVHDYDNLAASGRRQKRRRNLAPKVTPAPRPRPRQSDVVPDSQEEAGVHDRASSPAVPLMYALSLGTGAALHPPTATQAAIKSPLRKGQLPEGITDTQGRGPLSSVKTSNKITQAVQKQLHKADNTVAPVQDEESIEVDKDQVQPEARQSRGQIQKHKTVVIGRSQVKQFSPERKKETLAAGPSTRSRKRRSDTAAESSRGSEVPSTTSVPPKKRHRSAVIATPAPTAATLLKIRVLARRVDKRNVYYPGTVCVEITPSDPAPASTLFTVQFDDGFEEDVDVEYMRQFQLEPDDVVRVTRRRKGRTRVCPAQVLDVERWDTAEVAEVHELDQGPDADDYDIKGKYLSVSEDRIYDQWNERRVSTRTLLRDQDFDQPAHNDCLSGMGFIITLPDIPKSKRSLMKLIEVSGGLVYDDWSAIVSFNGSVEVAGKRIVGRTADMRIVKDSRKAPPSALFCLTNEPRTTPKYIIALALGVPCLSIDWVLDRVVQDPEHYVDWPAYILPAGYNPVTRMPASQAFNRTWWLKGDNLPKLLSQPPILKPFAGKAFLCVGAPDFLFSKKELGTFPKVLLAMGASYVQAVTEVGRINVKGSHDFDYTVVDDGEALVEYKNAIPVNVSWLKKCLVTGIEGPIPWPDRELT